MGAVLNKRAAADFEAVWDRKELYKQFRVNHVILEKGAWTELVMQKGIHGDRMKDLSVVHINNRRMMYAFFDFAANLFFRTSAFCPSSFSCQHGYL